ncbi:Molybdenum cofactor sulfurase-like protein [Drosera capensis]
MQSPRTSDASQICLHGCCPTPFHHTQQGAPQIISKPTTSSAAIRRSFVTTTATSLFPDARFTNHESLPPLQEAFAEFIRAYPNYSETYQIDRIRALEYYHLSLSSHVCLDYIGIGLFSFSQLNDDSNPVLSTTASTSTTPPTNNSDFPLFSLSYSSVNLKSRLQGEGRESKFESAIKKRIWEFLNLSEDDYSLVFTANRTSAFKLLAEAYPFRLYNKLVTVYDHKNEAVEALISSSEKRGAHAMAAEFAWPRLRLLSTKLSNMIVGKRKKRKGLFVFQLQSRATGARYSHRWMRMAQEHGWHVMLDACALGAKDVDRFGLSLFQPDFLVCSFYKVFGENPSGFGGLFVKKSVASFLEASTNAGIVSLAPMKKLSSPSDESSDSETEVDQTAGSTAGEKQLPSSDSCDLTACQVPESETSTEIIRKKEPSIECRCLDHVDSLRLTMISNRGRYVINWLINALLKLQYPHSDKGIPLVRIYGPKVKFDRGPAMAFNVYDWKGDKIKPVLVQKLADRENISLSCTFLQNIWFSDKYEAEKGQVLEKRKLESNGNENPSKSHKDHPDFVEKERWRYTALNQETIDI